MKNHKVVTKNNNSYYRIRVSGVTLQLPLFTLANNTKIAIFNSLGETVLTCKFAKALAKKFPKDIDVIVTPEVKSVCLAHELSRILKVPLVVVRKTLKPYMVDSIGEKVTSITTGKPQTLWLDGKDTKLVENKNVVIVDDVISTGSTLEALRKLVKQAKGKVIVESAVFTEGDKNSWPDVIALGHLPIFKD